MTSTRTRRGVRAGFAGFVVAGLLAGLVGCATSGGSSSTEQTTAGDTLEVAVIGDSIALTSPNRCPGCTGFVDSFAAAIAEERGVPFEVTSRARDDGARTSDIRQQVRSGYVDNVIGGADVVIVSTGYYDQPPYGREGDACGAIPSGSEADAVAAVLATTPDCIADQTAAAAGQLANVLEGVRERVPGAQILVLTPYNSWTGSPLVDASSPDEAERVTTTVVAALDAWRTAACAAAADADAACVDLLSAFNGPDGTAPAGDLLAADHIHPSQAGNDLIRDLLLAAQR